MNEMQRTRAITFGINIECQQKMRGLFFNNKYFYEIAQNASNRAKAAVVRSGSTASVGMLIFNVNVATRSSQLLVQEKRSLQSCIYSFSCNFSLGLVLSKIYAKTTCKHMTIFVQVFKVNYCIALFIYSY